MRISPRPENSRIHTQCDSLLIGDQCGAHTFPYIENRNPSAKLEHEATTSRIGEDQLFYCLQRGISEEDAVSMIVDGFCKQVFRELPMEFAVEAKALLGLARFLKGYPNDRSLVREGLEDLQQLDLDRDAYVTDLIKEDSTGVGGFEKARFVFIRTGECTLFIAK